MHAWTLHKRAPTCSTCQRKFAVGGGQEGVCVGGVGAPMPSGKWYLDGMAGVALEPGEVEGLENAFVKGPEKSGLCLEDSPGIIDSDVAGEEKCKGRGWEREWALHRRLPGCWDKVRRRSTSVEKVILSDSPRWCYSSAVGVVSLVDSPISVHGGLVWGWKCCEENNDAIIVPGGLNTQDGHYWIGCGTVRMRHM
ncbi:hypothetical protein BDZ91DRAFT_764128 [Kalaharituber pfeilii]|nr:hypothetical protein BDZ91DRAFT_764128 [Kalaharituber pfeilii]